MYKVKINVPTSGIDDYSFITEMPKIQNIGDLIGIQNDDEFDIGEVVYIFYEFNQDGSFLLTEINCKLI